MASPRDPNDLSILFELFTVQQRVRQLMAMAMTDAPIRPDEYAVYSLLQSEGARSPTSIASRMGMPVTTLLEYTGAMVERGHARKLPNPDDGRSYLLTLTPEGLDVQRAAGRMFDTAMEPLLERLESPAEIRRAIDQLRDALDDTRAHLDDA